MSPVDPTHMIIEGQFHKFRVLLRLVALYLKGVHLFPLHSMSE